MIPQREKNKPAVFDVADDKRDINAGGSCTLLLLADTTGAGAFAGT